MNMASMQLFFPDTLKKLNPLDGVYYCDIRPNMRTEAILKDHIKTFYNLLIEDIWKFI
jgi:hypothetical protein